MRASGSLCADQRQAIDGAASQEAQTTTNATIEIITELAAIAKSVKSLIAPYIRHPLL
jgi:hypothetical protein